MGEGFLSEEKVSEIRDRSSILEIVSDYVHLKKTGKNYRGLCPFHSEKTPSFMVNEEKQIFHCFGCGAGGDVFTFLMKAGRFSFPQAVEELAKRYGIRLPTRELSPAKKKEMDKREILYKINQTASEYFHEVLSRHREGEAGRRYLARRGMSEEIIQEYRLGYSLERWDGLVQHLQAKKVPLDLARELGLISPKKSGGRYESASGWYDAFRGRILFPIFDLHQRVVGFGGRLIREGEPKYLNSPESSIYHKGEILYGLQVAKGAIPKKDSVIIAEGYFDLLTLHQFGLKHSVATLGTALTAQQVRLLKRYTKNVITVFDADQAGIRASLRALSLFLEEDVSGKMVILPQDEDPDEFLRKGNLEEFEKREAHAVPLIDFFFEQLMKAHDIKSIDGKVKAAEEGMALIDKAPNRIRKNFYTRALAEKLDLPESLLMERSPSSLKDRPKGREDPKGDPLEKSFPKSEEIVVRLMIHHPELIPAITVEGIVKEFESPILRGMAERLESLYQSKKRMDVAEILGSFEDDLKERLCQFVFQESDLEAGDRKRILKDCIEKIHKKRLKKDEGEILKRIKEAEKQKGAVGLEALLTEWQELTRRGKTV
ncbi:MAG: DNA primase [Thermodesulfobacteriota bacterium]